MSLINIFTLDLDLKNPNYVSEPNITSSDSARFVVNITDDGLPYDLTGSTTYTLASTRPDGQVILKSGTKTGSNQLTFDFGAPSTTIPGTINAKIQMYDSAGRVSVVGFTYLVVKDPSGTNYTPTSYDQTLIQEVLGQGPATLAAAEEATQDAIDATEIVLTTDGNVQAAENIRFASENTRISQENTRQTNESTRISNETSRSNAESSRVSVESARVASENSRVSVESERVTTENSRVSAETARNTNETNRVSAETARATAESTRATNASTMLTNMQITWKGTVATFAALPSSNRTTGDTWTVTTDGTSTNNGFWRWSGTAWVQINNINPNGTALQSDLSLVDVARADLFRASTMSGVFTYGGVWGTGMDGSAASQGNIRTPTAAQFATYLNQVQMDAFHSLINGYKTFVNTAGQPNLRNLVTLSAPPTYGTREDLVFLEAWFPTNGAVGQMSWRLRVVDGVDFIRFAEGMCGSPSEYNAVGWSDIYFVQPQGGNAAPVVFNTTTDTTRIGYFIKANGGYASNTAVIINRPIINSLGDQGLYIAGNGDTASKTALATADGYVYAIPLFRVKRRNSGGYRKDNLNGARDYSAITCTVPALTPYIQNVTLTVAVGNTSGLKVGDILSNQGLTDSVWLITSIISSTSFTANFLLNSTYAGGNLPYVLKSDRPDNLFSNIIDASDIIDLRHKVSLTGVNYQQVVEESFDQLMRGTLTTKATKTAAKEVYGLRKAPLGLKQELQSTTIKRTDGMFVDLVNKIGLLGGKNINDVSTSNATKINKTDDGVYEQYTATASGEFGFTLTPFSVDQTKNYLVVAEMKKISGSFTTFRIRFSDASYTTVGTYNDKTSSTSWTNHYAKITASSLASGTVNKVLVTGVGNVTIGDVMAVRNVRLYEVDASTNNLIDVDPNWTGGDKIGALFPYVDSYPNFVENLVPPVNTWTVTGTPGDLTPTKGTTTGASGTNMVSPRFPVIPTSKLSVQAIMTGGSNVFFKIHKYDIAGTWLGELYGASTVPTSITVDSNTYLLTVQVLNVSSPSSSITMSIENCQIEAYPNVNPYVPYGRYYLEKDQIGNLHLSPNANYRYEGQNGGNFNSQRLVFSDAQTSQTVVDVVEALMTPQRHIKVTQATAGVWASGDTIKLRSDYGVIGGVVDSDTGVYRVTKYVSGGSVGSNTIVLTLDNVSSIAVNDTLAFTYPSSSSLGLVQSGAVWTVTVIDNTTNQVSISINTTFGVVSSDAQFVGGTFIETTAASSAPAIAYTAQVGNKLAQAGTNSTVTLASDASSITDYYKGLLLSANIGSVWQTKTITAYNGSTKVATMDSGFTGNPTNGTWYNISMPGTWTGLGTKEATFTLGTMPTAVDATLGNANALNVTITSSINYPAGKGYTNVPTDISKVEVNGGELLAANTVSVKTNFLGKVSGSTDLNPNKSQRHASGGDAAYVTLQTPSGTWSEATDNNYITMMTLDGVSHSRSLSGTGQMAQQLFSWDVIRTIEDKYGEIPADGLAAKIAWVKTNISSVLCDWFGSGSSLLGNKATVKYWVASGTPAWSTFEGTNITGSIAKVSLTGITANNAIDSNGFAHFLAYADPAGLVADPTVAPTLSTSANTSKNLNPRFADWTRHANAVINSDYSLTLNATATSQQNTVVIPASPSTQYSFGSTHNARVAIYSVNSGGTETSVVGSTGSQTSTFTTLADAVSIKIMFTSGTLGAGTYTMTNPQLELGATNTTFQPKPLDPGTYYVKYAWGITGVGASLPSPESNITITAGQNMVTTVPSLPFGVSYANVYISTTSGPTAGTNQGTTGGGTTYTQSTALTSNGSVPRVVSDAIVPSTISTDYVELSITLKTANVSAYDSSTDASGYTVLQPTNPFPVLSENLLTANQAFPVDLNGFSYGSGATISVDTLGIIKVDTPTSSYGLFMNAIFGSFVVGDYVTVSFEINSTNTTRVAANNVGASGNPIPFQVIPSTNGTWTKVVYTGKIQTASAGGLEIYNPTGSIQTFYVRKFKVEKGVNPSPEWTPGRRKKVTLNFLGKLAGSTVENPNSAGRKSSSTFLSPNWTNYLSYNDGQAAWDNMSKQDGVLQTFTTSTNGNYAQQLFEFDLSHLGMSLSELKKAIRNINATVVAYGTGDNAGVLTYGAVTKMWIESSNNWIGWSTHSSTIPAAIVNTTSNPLYITKDQKMYILVHSTYPASATNPSNIYTDYIKLDVTLADYVDYVPANIVKIRPETKEVKTFFPNNSSRYLGHQGVCGESQIGLHYRHMPYQGLGNIGKSKILAVGTPIITTLGTGAYPSDTSNTAGISALSTKLPSPVFDHQLIADKFMSDGVSTTIDGLILKLNSLSGVGYRATAKAGMYFDPSSSSVETVVRGNSTRSTLSSDTISSSLGQAVYKFNLPTTLPTEALISLPILVNDGSELKMVIVSFRKSRNSVLMFSASECVNDSFKLAGRPLIKQ